MQSNNNKNKLHVLTHEVAAYKQEGMEYICITGMTRYKNLVRIIWSGRKTCIPSAPIWRKA